MRHRLRPLIFLLFSACNSAGFSGSSGGSGGGSSGGADQHPDGHANAQPGAPASPAAASSPSPSPAACSGSLTTARLVSTQVADGAQTATLEYQLALTDCAGQAQTIDADKIFFDFDGCSYFATKSISIAIGDGQQLAYQGKLLPIPGTDLFGRSGASYRHYESDNPFKLSTAAAALDIKIVIGDIGLITAAQTNTYTGPFKLPTFLRLGTAAKPVQTDVLMVKP